MHCQRARVKTEDKNIITWLRGEMLANWELRFTRNMLLSKKGWLSVLNISHIKKSSFEWLKE